MIITNSNSLKWKLEIFKKKKKSYNLNRDKWEDVLFFYFLQDTAWKKALELQINKMKEFWKYSLLNASKCNCKMALVNCFKHVN